MASISFTFIANDEIVIGGLNPPPGEVNQPYSHQFTATGGSGSYVWVMAGTIPGVTLSASGLLSGTPSAAGSYNVTVTVSSA